MELLKYYDMNVQYHPGKANIVGDGLSSMSMGSTSDAEDGKKQFIHKLARLGVRLVDFTIVGV